ncbi:MAG: hypothetical protein J6R42_02440 [Clostridia bacterium]|nr:hypothetical protein [Clostridia bacterium]
MSRVESYRRIERSDLTSHGEAIILQLTQKEEYIEAAEQAQALGVSISVYMRDTYTDEKKYEYELPEDEQDIPYGYQGDLRIDITRDGRILFARDESGAYNQLSVSYPIIYTPDSIFGHKLKFLDFEEIDGGESIIQYICDFLDIVKEAKGGVVSVLRAEEQCPEKAVASLDMYDIETLPEGDVVELLPGSFAGIYLGESSVFFTPDGFLPLTLLLESREFGFYTVHGVSQIDEARWSTLRQDIFDLCECLKDFPCGFTDILSDMKLYSLEPSGREEKLLNQISILRPEEYTDTLMRFLKWGDEQMAALPDDDKIISILWP